MGEKAQLLGRRVVHQALTRAWNTCAGQVQQAFGLGDRSLQDTENLLSNMRWGLAHFPSLAPGGV